MPRYDEFKNLYRLSERSDTNSVVDLVSDKYTGTRCVRKTIFGIDQPLYQGIFSREVQALYKLNTCENIVKILGHKNLVYVKKNTYDKEKVGCIFLEYISGETLTNTNISNLTSKQKFKIIKQLLSAIEIAHYNGIIHRDINPNNIMLDDNGDVKVIDFGICKIKQMVKSATVYHMGTNLYSAPEVHLNSQNATEQSDLYSIGAVIYYLFTGEQPPIATCFQDIINHASGFDVNLKPIVKKLVAENPNERYKDVSELKNDLTELIERFLDVNYTAVLTVAYEKFVKLKNLNLIPKNSIIGDLKTTLPANFLELYINQVEDKYQFLGTNYYFECIYNAQTNIFAVTDVRKIVPIEREIMKKKFCEISARLDFVNPKFIHRLSRNDNLEIKNIVDAHCDEYRSKHNIDAEYKRKYGAWRDLLTLTKKSIEDSVQRFPYDSYTIEGSVCSFNLSAGVFLGDTVYTKENKFIFEKTNKNKNKKQLIYIGNYDEDSFVDEHVVLKIRFLRKPDRLPSKGSICLDYSESITNIERQLDALDSIERENYSCQYNLKEIVAGVTPPKTSLLQGKVRFFNSKLDLPQKTAVEKALNSESLTIIQGPPGTGKTNVVIEIIRQILKMNTDYPDLPEKKILLVSQSHPAVDKMLDDLIRQSNDRPNLIRVGRDEKLNDEIREEFGLNYLKDNWIAEVRDNCASLAEYYCKEIGVTYEEFEKYYREYEKQFISNIDHNAINQQVIDAFVSKTSTPSKEKTRMILEIQKQWEERLPQCEEVDLYIIKSTTIIAGTCTGFISNRVIRNAGFDYVIVDEAAKATYPELAVSFAKAEKIILVGDHKQLPPVLDTEIIEANKNAIHLEDLTEGLFEKLYNNFPENNKHRLTIQYRMHPVIGSLISKVFYDNEIQNGTPKEQRYTGISCYEDVAIEWITTSSLSSYKRFEKKVGNETNATYKNNAELDIIKNKLCELDSLVSNPIKVGVITAYRAQKSAIKDMVRQQNFNFLQIEVDTVDAFQGGQKEIIIYSTVRSSDKSKRIGFLKSEARLNVSLSRAQSLLIIVGDLDFLNNPQIQGNKFPEIIEYINQTEGCKITVARDWL